MLSYVSISILVSAIKGAQYILSLCIHIYFNFLPLRGCTKVLPVSVSFPLSGLPTDFDVSATIVLRVRSETPRVATHVRRMQRSPPPGAAANNVATWQVCGHSHYPMRRCT